MRGTASSRSILSYSNLHILFLAQGLGRWELLSLSFSVGEL